MCGICGQIVTSNGSQPSQKIVSEMNRHLLHRGPDDTGEYIDHKVAMAMTRLAIINPKLNKQPLHDRENGLIITFNGEIYNHHALREELKSKGEIFSNSGDTEVLLKSYKIWGDDFLHKLNGMFAIAIWDKYKNRLLLARDQMGQKPLFWLRANNYAYWASELSAFKAIPELELGLNISAIDQYLNLDFISAPLSIYANIQSLKAGELLILENDSPPLSRKWWNPVCTPKLSGSKKNLLQECRNNLTSAVERTLISDRPLGIFLSGGLDSSVIAAIVTKYFKKEVKTFSLALDDKDYDESHFSQLIANDLNTNHSKVLLDAENFKESALNCIHRLDQPLADPALIALFHLSQSAAKEIKVALTGDGGDETLGGYSRYIADRSIPYIPKILAKLACGMLHLTPLSKKQNSDYNLFKALKTLASQNRELKNFSFLFWKKHTDASVWKDMFRNEVSDKVRSSNLTKLFEPFVDESETLSKLDLSLLQDQNLYLANDLLPKTDRASMLHGLEARAPYLDLEWLKCCARLPDKYKIKGFKTKVILRESFSDIIPAIITKRKKRGFNLPLDKWLATDLREWACNAILSSKKLHHIFEQSKLETFCHKNLSPTHAKAELIWPLVVLALWLEKN